MTRTARIDRVIVIIPALNEALAIGDVISAMPSWVSEVRVADNGSTDATAEIAAGCGATVISVTQRGYGSACLGALERLPDCDIVAFIDGDGSSDVTQLESLVTPIVDGHADLVIGSRQLGEIEPGAMNFPQRAGNAIACAMIRIGWRVPCTDLGPFRAIHRDALDSLSMDDPDFGWTVQMQLRAISAAMNVQEVPVDYRRQLGRSKISGTLGGVIGAGRKIIGTIIRHRLFGSG